ncbi:hypothetical protein bcgnr5378_37000 [Bacillus cereus]
MAADTGNELPNKVKDKAEDIINFFIMHLLFIYDEFSPSYENVFIFQGKIKKSSWNRFVMGFCKLHNTVFLEIVDCRYRYKMY